MPSWIFDFDYENDTDVFVWIEENVPKDHIVRRIATRVTPKDHIVRRIATQVTKYPHGVPFAQMYQGQSIVWRHVIVLDDPDSAALFKLRWGGVIDSSG